MKKKVFITILVLFLGLSIFSVYIMIISSQIILNFDKHIKENNPYFLTKIKKYVPRAKYLVPIMFIEERDITKLSATYEIMVNENILFGHATFAKKKLLCDVCNDVNILILTDIKGQILNVISIEEIEIEGETIYPTKFLNQFIGKTDLNCSIENITGATYSAEAIIDLINEAIIKIRTIEN